MAYDAEQKRLERRRKLAESLMGARQPQGQMVGRFYVAPSPFQHLAGVASQLVGAKIGSDIDTEEKELSDKRKQALVDALTKSQELMQDRPNDAPYYLRNSEVIPGDPMAAATHLLSTDNPIAQKLGADIFGQQIKPKSGFTLSPGQTRFGPGGKPLAELPATPGEKWSDPYEYQGSLVQRNLKTGQIKAAVAQQPRTQIPPRTLVLDAKDLIKSDPGISTLPPEQQDALAFNVASRTRALMAQDRSLDASAAMAIALDEQMENLKPGETRSFLGFDLLRPDKPAEYTDPRRAAPSPAPSAAPSGEAPPPQALQGLTEGMQRRFANGQVWTIQNGQPVRVQ